MHCPQRVVNFCKAMEVLIKNNLVSPIKLGYLLNISQPLLPAPGGGIDSFYVQKHNIFSFSLFMKYEKRVGVNIGFPP